MGESGSDFAPPPRRFAATLATRGRDRVLPEASKHEARASSDQAHTPRAALWTGGLAIAALALVSLALWARYGGAVFMEMIATAWAYCF